MPGKRALERAEAPASNEVRLNFNDTAPFSCDAAGAAARDRGAGIMSGMSALTPCSPDLSRPGKSRHRHRRHAAEHHIDRALAGGEGTVVGFVVFTSNLGIYADGPGGERVLNVSPGEPFEAVQAKVRAGIDHH